MTRGQSEDVETTASADWPTFELVHTYNPTELSASLTLQPDELVVFDPDGDGDIDETWITAERGSYTPIEETQ